MSESWFQAQPKNQSLVYFWHRATVQARRFNTFSGPKF